MAAMETEEQVQQFIILMEKNEIELRAICEGMELDVSGSKEELVNRVVSQELKQEHDPLLPQAIPLRSRTEDPTLTPIIAKVYKAWRKDIFDLCQAPKEFKLVDSRGKQYVQSMRYLYASGSLSWIISNKLYDPAYVDQETLIDYLTKKPGDFEAHIVQKETGSGKSFLMLHVELKKAA